MFSHLNKNKQPKIVDISNKKITNRTAVAEGIVKFSKSTFKKLDSFTTKKGEINNIAILAGIMGAKKTSELIPLCHNINIENVDIKIQKNNKLSSLIIKAIVKAKDKTGVEMESLTAVSIACLTIYDMCKSIDKKIIINNIRLIKKTGGKSNINNSKK
ncbi:MAG: Cyclic pyranopterin monophosphate synthase accessory protein [Alphaproteobacteria bacterium MarineAlpha5_Bin8]|nr:MAG: Cyclic pyranopterin monophosphate synthase accessory protein [Alphaproteobacteria bacterium MarineAlpha5_Bin7]PPR46574.1 MAG: Cyclic pyranopterin monophosphate synthase accessory protein [Alphaproteobacteria bacterium MarineAlpha5_Bin8]PPR53282.1 MAG: Cyclic pyranopterin monophosphate synthase accessory protein [Alphaproteobacteria bacterium MarineAlpha5_Bin6]|tara:strand:- start:269 stop:742 length:474 start_codon:yes stop_codon:yes gene_type:complete